MTPNDADDSDTGANNLQNFPVVDSAVNDGSATLVTGTLASFGDAAFRVDVFASDSCDPSGNGEGARYLGADDVVTAPDGTAAFSLNGVPTAQAGAGDFITTTATDLTGFNTSEFSSCHAVTAEAFIVNAVDDVDNGACDSSHCSLREAINAANGVGGFQTITFAIPGAGQQTIAVASALPSITEAVTIDGTSQPGYGGTPLIVVDGSGAGATTYGLVLGFAPAAAGSTIQGLAVVNFGGYGILIQGDDDAVLDSYVGTADGTTAEPNATGVRVDPGSQGAEVRDSLISGNLGAGVETNGTGLLIAGNRIGTNFSSDGVLPNGIHGIFIGLPGSDTMVGGDTDLTPGIGNIIAGNAQAGILIDGSSGNVVQGNLIGTNSEGTDLGNGGAGVQHHQRRPGEPHRRRPVRDVDPGPGRERHCLQRRSRRRVVLSGASDADFNEVHSNAIFDNAGLGIDLEGDGVTPNDPGDGDDGANDLRNFPDLIEARERRERHGRVRSQARPPKSALIIVYQLFVSDSCDPSGNGEGERYLHDRRYHG